MLVFLFNANIHLLKSNKTSIDNELFNVRTNIAQKKRELRILEERLLTLNRAQQKISSDLSLCMNIKKYKKYAEN